MKLISLNKIADDMILARNVYAREGNVLLAKEAPLKHNYIKRLLDWGVNSVYVQDSQGDLLEIDEELCKQAKEDALKLGADFLAALNSEQLPESAKQMIDEVLKQLLAESNILQNLVEIKSVNDNLFRHCVTVSVLSMVIGTFAGYGANQLTELATGAILIDVGKTAFAHLLVDPNQLSPAESLELQKHTKQGFEKLKQFTGHNENSAQIILQHHEKYDGSGFPQGLKGNQIHEYARIGAIADIFHLYQTKGRKANPSQMIADGSGTLFDPDFTQLFSQKVAPLITNRTANSSDQTVQTDRSPEAQEHNALNMSTTPSLFEQAAKMVGSFTNPVRNSDVTEGQEASTLKNQKQFSNRQTIVQKSKQGELDHLPVGQQFKVGDWEQQSIDSNLNQASAKRNAANTAVSDKFTVNPERCQQATDEALQIVAQSFARISTVLVSKVVIEATRTTINELITDSDVVSNLAAIQALDDNTFSHCIAVGVLSVMTGASLGYTPEQLKELGTGSLLVDLGKVEIARKYNVDSSSLGSVEHAALMPEHTQLGFEQLWKLKRNTNIPYIALQHHERYDGLGIPTGLKGQQINELARIVALADVYDTLINEGMNGQKLMPHEVIEYIRDYSGSHFDPELSRVFLQNITPFLINSNVLLNTGEKAKVIQINKELLARPVIRVMMDKDGNMLPKPIVKDLVTDLTLFIVRALPDDEF